MISYSKVNILSTHIKTRFEQSLFCHPEPCPETSNAILNLVQDQGLRFQGLLLRDAETSLPRRDSELDPEFISGQGSE